MVDEFLLQKIRERMGVEGAKIEEVRESFEHVYAKEDIDQAISAYEDDMEKPPLPALKEKQMRRPKNNLC